MRSERLLLCLLGFSGLVACGGRVLDDRGSDGSDTSQPAAPASAGSGGKSSGDSGTTVRLPTQELGQCRPGFSRAQNPALPCHWVTEAGMCFEESDAACDCVCPKDRDSVCAHGFDRGPNSATLVVCD
jgi:hypothetical protein